MLCIQHHASNRFYLIYFFDALHVASKCFCWILRGFEFCFAPLQPPWLKGFGTLADARSQGAKKPQVELWVVPVALRLLITFMSLGTKLAFSEVFCSEMFLWVNDNLVLWVFPDVVLI